MIVMSYGRCNLAGLSDDDCKHRSLLVTPFIKYDVTKCEQFLQWGSMGKFLIFCWIQLKFRFWIHKKCWHTSWKFQLEIRSNEKVNTKMRLINLYEMNSSTMVQTSLLLYFLVSNNFFSFMSNSHLEPSDICLHCLKM